MPPLASDVLSKETMTALQMPCDKCSGTGLVNDPRVTGQLLRKEREQAGVSLRALAGKLEVSAAYLSDLERGRRNWSEGKIAGYRRILGTP